MSTEISDSQGEMKIIDQNCSQDSLESSSQQQITVEQQTNQQHSQHINHHHQQQIDGVSFSLSTLQALGSAGMLTIPSIQQASLFFINFNRRVNACRAKTHIYV